MSEELIVKRQQINLDWPKEAENLNNYGILSGRLQGDFQYSHRFCRQNYYKTKIEIRRRSGTLDIIPIVISEDVLGSVGAKELKGKYVKVTGQICTYDVRNDFAKDGEMHHLRICFSADSIAESEAQEELNNVVYLKGRLCKPPFVKTKMSGAKITEVFLAVRRKDGRRDYIPCVSWEPIASSIENEFTIGDVIQLQGRFQSRRYFKKDWQNSYEGQYKTAYEVAIAQVF